MTDQEIERAVNAEVFGQLRVNLLSNEQMRMLLDQIAEHWKGGQPVRVLLEVNDGQVNCMGSTFPVEVDIVDYDISPQWDKPEDFDLPYYNEDGRWIGVISTQGAAGSDEGDEAFWKLIDGK